MISECVYCEQTVELAEDGAWQSVESGACGCTASLEQGGEGEHDVGGRTALDAGLVNEHGALTERAFNVMDGAGEIRLVDVQIGRFPDGSPNPYEFGC